MPASKTYIKGDDSYPALQPIELEQLSNCRLCPRNCGANRFSEKSGFCKSDASFRVSVICAHKGEEPVISGKKGICNVFFPHCNLQCVYCQNYEISHNERSILQESISYSDLIGKICAVLDKTENMLGFVSPSHYVPHILAIIRGIKETGRNPVIVYNTNGYDKVETLKSLEGIVDVYLPDFKYLDPDLALRYSQTGDYPEVASVALKEMYRQKGSSLFLNDRGLAESGIVLRHLVLPGSIQQSIEVLQFIANEISTNLHISLMSQYYPTGYIREYEELKRTLFTEEYKKVKQAFYKLGFYRGWVQNLNSHSTYRPDFNGDQPFDD